MTVLPRYDFSPNTTHLETVPAEIAGITGEILVLRHTTPEGIIYEAVFCGEVATQPVFIGEAYARKPTRDDLEVFKTRGKVREHIERQKELRQGWN